MAPPFSLLSRLAKTMSNKGFFWLYENALLLQQELSDTFGTTV